jgi:hypothetical protein
MAISETYEAIFRKLEVIDAKLDAIRQPETDGDDLPAREACAAPDAAGQDPEPPR